MSGRVGSVTAQIIPVLLDVASSYGVVASEVMDRFEIPPEWRTDPEARVPLPLILRIWEELPEMCEAPDFGLTVGERLKEADFLLRMVVAGSPTARVACERVLRIERIINDLPGIPPTTFEVIDGEVGLTHHYPTLPRHTAEMTCAIWVGHFELFGGPVEVRSVWFRHPAPEDLTRHLEVFGVEPHFGTDRTMVRFPAEALDRPNLLYSRILEALAEPYLEMALRRFPLYDPIAEVRDAIDALLPEGVPRLPAVARALGMSTRSLQRRLRENGASFSALLDAAREARARRSLADPSIPLFAVALDTGFSEQSSFTRAFQRWTGMTPGQFRASASR